ncbi:hypothetical protein ACFL35_16705 [Candidatus Riflebacteria bacterium]
MPDFITLTCPVCAERIEIPPRIERADCTNCGKEYIVKRGGGIVRLEAITQAIHEVKAEVTGVRVEVDKTASEPAIVRLKKEIQEEEIELKKSRSNVVCGVGLLAIAVAMLISNPMLFELTGQIRGNASTKIVGGVFLVLGLMSSYSESRRYLEKAKKIESKKQEVEKHKTIVSS